MIWGRVRFSSTSATSAMPVFTRRQDVFVPKSIFTDVRVFRYMWQSTLWPHFLCFLCCRVNCEEDLYVHINGDGNYDVACQQTPTWSHEEITRYRETGSRVKLCLKSADIHFIIMRTRRHADPCTALFP